MDLAPYWFDVGVTRVTVFWALSLAVCSAAIVGVVPALKVTGRAVHRNIQRATSGRLGVRFGGMSSALIVADVALAVATLGLAVVFSYGLTGSRDGMGNLSEEFLSARVTIPQIGDTLYPLDKEQPVGKITSMALSQRFGPIALAIVKRPFHQPGNELVTHDEEQSITAVTTALPFQ